MPRRFFGTVAEAGTEVVSGRVMEVEAPEAPSAV
jgi:hypothetical protein